MKPLLGKILMLLVSACLATIPCSARKKAAPIDPKFQQITHLAILPTINGMADGKRPSFFNDVPKVARQMLKKKHYSVDVSKDLGLGDKIDVDDLDSPRATFVSRLGPSSERWVLVLMLVDAHSKLTFGSTGNAEVRAWLFDKSDGTLVWSGVGRGATGQGGLMGMAMKGFMTGAAIDSATQSVIASLPPRAK